MGQFFKPWRRKLGLVALGLECVFAAVWVRSNRIRDFVDIPSWNSHHQIISESGCVCWKWQGHDPDDDTDIMPPLRWWCNPIRDQHLEVIGFVFVNDRNVPVTNVSAPYWFIVIPLTLFSLWLLLSKPHKSNQKKITERISEKVA